MMSRVAFLALILLALVVPVAAQQQQTVTVAFIDRDGDPFYLPAEGYSGIYRIARGSAFSGAELAVKDAKILERAENVKFTLMHRTLGDGQTVEAALAELEAQEKPVAVLLDLPLPEVEAAARLAAVPVFNIRHRDTGLRARTCGSKLFHTIPAEAMLQDGLVQFLRSANYDNVLVIEGDSAEDQSISQAFQASAAKFGLDIAEVRHFVHGYDPRQRDLNNVKLLTGGVDYDVVFVANLCEAWSEREAGLPDRWAIAANAEIYYRAEV